jgi:glutamate-ammonia-ligase adenylyltransferase
MRHGDGIAASEAALMAELRRDKAALHLLIALGDLSGTLPVMRRPTGCRVSPRSRSGASLAWICCATPTRAASSSCPTRSEPEKGSGWIVLSMGKLGAHELNYSSDIDLIVLFDPDPPGLTWPDRYMIGETMNRMTRRLIRIMQERTGDGYVFRSDLRLRPDPGATPLAIGVEAALVYYEARGQNWERAAMIKAKAAAGDIEAGERFLYDLRPFIWRKHLDYASIADVHSIKRQIHAHKGHGAIAIEGHNVKLGRGGIREIEFFVQTQQLIFGGRVPELRGRGTISMLQALADHGSIEDDAADTLTRCYCFLRRVEHAIQMIGDEQTHKLPEDAAGIDRVARMLGYEGSEPFRADLLGTLRAVETHYAELFEHEAELGDEGNLVFTGGEPDPDTVETLVAHGLCASRRHLARRQPVAHGPLSRRAVRARPRTADRDHAAPAQDLWRKRPCRRGRHRLRPLPLRPAGRHPGLLHAAVQSAADPASRADPFVGAAARLDHHRKAARLRRHARSGLLLRRAERRRNSASAWRISRRGAGL